MSVIGIAPPPPKDSVQLQPKLQGDKPPPTDIFNVPDPQPDATVTPPPDAQPFSGLPAPQISTDTFLSLLDMGQPQDEMKDDRASNSVGSGLGTQLG